NAVFDNCCRFYRMVYPAAVGCLVGGDCRIEENEVAVIIDTAAEVCLVTADYCIDDGRGCAGRVQINRASMSLGTVSQHTAVLQVKCRRFIGQIDPAAIAI